MATFAKTMRPIFTAFGLVTVATALMLLVRFQLVEPESIAAGCAARDEGWRCFLRDNFVFGFLHNVYGWTAVLTGAFATITRWRWLAGIAILASVAGAVLYTFELCGVGLLLGALVWVRVPVRSVDAREQSGDQQ